jgi:glycosyltransferase involved in cell wall biosynthesis
MRIIYVIWYLELGGAEQHLLRVTSELRRRGFLPEVFALSLQGSLLPAFAEHGVPVHGVTLPEWLTRLLRFKPIISGLRLFCSAIALLRLYWQRPAAVHFFLPSAYLIGGLVSVLAPRMLRIMSRRSRNHYQSKHPYLRRIEYWLHCRMDYICGNSQAVIEDLLEEGVAPDQLRLIYNGISLDTFRPVGERNTVRASLGISEHALVFVMVANLIPYKGHSDLIKAFTLIADQLPAGWVCLCAGRDDGIGLALREQVGKQGFHDNIRFVGSRRDIADILCAADIGILCSHEEGFSNAVIEGMACGLPMVVSDVGGNSEAVVHDRTGFVVPAKDAQTLAQALVKLALDEETRQAMGKLGRQRVEQNFSMTTCIDRYVSLYHRQLPHTC